MAGGNHFLLPAKISKQMIITVKRVCELRDFVGKRPNFVCEPCFIFAGINF